MSSRKISYIKLLESQSTIGGTEVLYQYENASLVNIDHRHLMFLLVKKSKCAATNWERAYCCHKTVCVAQ